MALILVKFTPEADFVSSKATNNHNWRKGERTFRKLVKDSDGKGKMVARHCPRKKEKMGKKQIVLVGQCR